MSQIATENVTVETNVVVQNDRSAIAVNAADKVHVAPIAVTPSVAEVRSRVAALIAERKEWEVGAYVASNTQLYAILAKCYQLYFDVRGTDAESRAARKALNEEIQNRGYRFNEGTHTLNKITKCVFDGVDRRRVSAYALVLRAAIDDATNPSDIPAFITNGGGVEQIRRRKSLNAVSPKQKAELGKLSVAAKQIAVINSPTLAAVAPDASAGDNLVAIVTMQADGSFVVRQLITNKSVVNAALACAYSVAKSVVKNDKQSQQAANDAKAIEELISSAAA
jgi:hypothetical protein